MNKIKVFSIQLLLLFVLYNCSDDFLVEKKDYNNFTFTIFHNEAQTNEYLAYIYNLYYKGYDRPIENIYGAPTSEYSNMTEEIGGNIPAYIDSTVLLVSAEDADDFYGQRLKQGSEFNDPYTRIRNCNQIIEGIEEYGRDHLEDHFIDQVKGQAYFLRGLQYFDLMRIYGGVPLVTKVQSASSSDESIKLPRAGIEEMLRQIAADFDMAASLLPSVWGAANYGHPTKGAALAMKSRALLTGASPLFNADWDNPANQRWENARLAGETAVTALEEAGYGLHGSSVNDWAKIFYAFDNTMCPEAIHVILCADITGTILANGWEKNIRLTSQGGDGIPAPKQMIDLFPMADGSRPTTENGYDGFLFFKNRDPRFYRTFGFSGLKWKHAGTSNNPAASVVWTYAYMGTDSAISKWHGNNDINSYAFVTKMTNLSVDSLVYNLSGSDIFEYRFAELLLNIAECYAAQEKISECINYLGKIRGRVGIPSVNNYGIGNLADKYQALEACIYERRVELAYEGKRFWDLQRWMLYNDDPAAGNNTCVKLGVAPLNGTSRTGMYLQVKDSITGKDPLLGVLNVYYDPDAANLQEQLDALATFYSTYFEFTGLINPMDQKLNIATVIDWKQHYYVHGIHSSILSTNPWLKQTVGWNDYFGNPGTFTYR